MFMQYMPQKFVYKNIYTIKDFTIEWFWKIIIILNEINSNTNTWHRKILKHNFLELWGTIQNSKKFNDLSRLNNYTTLKWYVIKIEGGKGQPWNPLHPFPSSFFIYNNYTRTTQWPPFSETCQMDSGTLAIVQCLYSIDLYKLSFEIVWLSGPDSVVKVLGNSRCFSKCYEIVLLLF